MRVTRSRLVACAVVALSGACSDDDAGTAWQGEDPHIEVKGDLNGEELDLTELDDMFCEREYEVPVIDGEAANEMARLVGFEVKGIAVIDGEERELEIDVEGPDIEDYFGGEIEVLPDGSDFEPGQAVVEVKWTRVEDDAELLDDDAASGTLKLEILSGPKGDGGVIIKDNEGKLGFAGELVFSATQSIKLSVTANCGENDLEELVSAP